MQALALAAVLLLALLAGFTIPVLLQLRTTLKRSELFIDATSAKLDLVIGEIMQLSTRANRVLGEVETSVPRLQRALAATDGIVSGLESLRAPLSMAAAIGPAAFAAVRALVASFLSSRSQDHSQEPGSEGAPTPAAKP